jgi:sigma-E factor negative regulatory protein RseC
MIEEQAQVVDLNQEGVWVETQRRSACGQCAANKGCGTATLSKVLGNKRNRVRALNPDATPVAIGDEVVIGIEEQALVRGSLALYIMPLFALFLFGLLGSALAEQFSLSQADAFSALFGLIGLAIGFLGVKWYSYAIRGDARFQPVLLRRVSPPIPY